MFFTDQPNLFIESGDHPSLHEQCHHQIIHGKLSISNLAPPLTHADYGFMTCNTLSSRKIIAMFRWQETLKEVTHTGQQVKVLDEGLLYICSNFIPKQAQKDKGTSRALDNS